MYTSKPLVTQGPMPSGCKGASGCVLFESVTLYTLQKAFFLCLFLFVCLFLAFYVGPTFLLECNAEVIVCQKWANKDTCRGGSMILVRGPSGVLTPDRALSWKFAQNRGFPLKIVWKLHDFEKILGARGGPVEAASFTNWPLWHSHSENLVVREKIQGLQVFGFFWGGGWIENVTFQYFAFWVKNQHAPFTISFQPIKIHLVIQESWTASSSTSQKGILASYKIKVICDNNSNCDLKMTNMSKCASKKYCPLAYKIILLDRSYYLTLYAS